MLNNNFSFEVQHENSPPLSPVDSTDVTAVIGTEDVSSLKTIGKSETPKKAKTVTEKVTIAIDEEDFSDTKQQVEDLLSLITQQVAKKEDNLDSIIKSIKVVERLTGMLFHKFDDAYQKKKKK